jgi:hypothetical protein
VAPELVPRTPPTRGVEVRWTRERPERANACATRTVRLPPCHVLDLCESDRPVGISDHSWSRGFAVGAIVGLISLTLSITIQLMMMTIRLTLLLVSMTARAISR